MTFLDSSSSLVLKAALPIGNHPIDNNKLLWTVTVEQYMGANIMNFCIFIFLKIHTEMVLFFNTCSHC